MMCVCVSACVGVYWVKVERACVSRSRYVFCFILMRRERERGENSIAPYLIMSITADGIIAYVKPCIDTS